MMQLWPWLMMNKNSLLTLFLTLIHIGVKKDQKLIFTSYNERLQLHIAILFVEIAICHCLQYCIHT